MKATAIESHPLQIAVSLLNATYSNEELATTLKSVTRNYPVSGDVKTHSGGASATKVAVSNHKDPNVQCYMHPDKPHLNKECFQQKRVAKETKEKNLKKSLAKAAKAKENAKAADSDTDWRVRDVDKDKCLYTVNNKISSLTSQIHKNPIALIDSASTNNYVMENNIPIKNKKIDTVPNSISTAGTETLQSIYTGNLPINIRQKLMVLLKI